MKLAVVIPTLGRKAVASRLLSHLESQSRLPDHVFVTAPDEGHVEQETSHSYPISMVFGGRGLCAQRNRALSQSIGGFDIITFFDDDFVPSDDYIKNVVDEFELHNEYSVLMGDVLYDGAHDKACSFEEAIRILQHAASSPPPFHDPVDHLGAYGCNMSIRTSAIGAVRFDEKLALYGWQEDIDFTAQLRRHGRVVRLSSLRGVHLGIRSGRVSGVRFGYSQMVNPVYLARKGTMPVGFAADLIFRNLAANLAKSLFPEPHIDRRGRLKGNLIGARHLIAGRIEPEYVLELK
ncbi:glycosyltransferase family 2 protein [Ancylobacter sonchi]|uniref:glycosyltransferase family 2 protein n=1 Tax=Ancylobacter sonchi TaxID=1937790 RepID=UPI001BD3D85B|nr:glycosyltransferase family 2 protein [Ancylobacter sonchi]MBS7533243.1 glycosyltransferase family 2 protein [Ancylobacter sonchi]